MTKEQFEALEKFIDALIDEKIGSMNNSQHAGNYYLKKEELRNELLLLLDEPDDGEFDERMFNVF